MPARKPPDPKLQALREQGTLNRRPEAVRDPAFQHSDFFDPRDLVQVRYEMLRRVRAEGRPAAEAAGRFGVSRPTYYKAQAAFEHEGLAGLLPAKRGPRGPHKLTPEVMRFLEAELQDQPTLGAAALAQRVRQALGVHVHPRTIERAWSRRKKKRP
jgi:transposase